MIPITVQELSRRIPSIQSTGDQSRTVNGICIDHRTIRPNDAFVAFIGQRVDGNNFVDEAFERGASVAIVSRDIETTNGPVIRVEDPLRSIQLLAIAERQAFLGPVVGITGSNGKTTTKQMVAAVLSKYGECLYTEGNRNTELGLPLTILQRSPEHRSIVLEMGMRGFGQIRDLCDIASPTIGVITNIGHSHLELLGSQEGIARAKGELLEALPQDGHAILNGDDPWLRRIAHLSSAPVTWYGTSDHSDVRASEISWTNEGMRFIAHVDGKTEFVTMPTYGTHNVSNALAAIAVGTRIGLEVTDCVEALGTLTSSTGRLHIVEGTTQHIIDDCYNASPASMMASLEVLAKLAKDTTSVAILGDMYELGVENERGHRNVGTYVAKLGIDRLLTIGKHSRWTNEAARASGLRNALHVDTVEEAIVHLRDFLPDGATVLVKASRGMQLERIVTVLKGL